jgi:hypothetical protein
LATPPVSMPKWGMEFESAWKKFKEGNLEAALPLSDALVREHPDYLLGAVLNLRILAARGDEINVIQKGNAYHAKWPDCIAISLLLASRKMEMGQESEAVSLLHECVSNDAVGQVAQRMWGVGHAYDPLWVDSFDFRFTYAIPAAVAELLGWNQLPAGDPVVSFSHAATPTSGSSTGTTETEAVLVDTAQVAAAVQEGVETAEDSIADSLRSVEEAFTNIARRVSNETINREEGRYPIYVVLSCRGGLVKQYGEQTSLVIEKDMKLLATAVSNRQGWGSRVFIVDDPNIRTELNISPIDAIDPWKIKLAVKDLDTMLSKKGEMIGALLIVGGPDVVPFHKLPNPTDDTDSEVPSDNPYATLDSNYFVPEWPVGRLPGDNSQDAALLLDQIHRLTTYHNQYRRLTSSSSLIEILFRLLDRIRAKAKETKKKRKSAVVNFGITAAVWRKASTNVFSPIGSSADLMISPPDQSGTFNISKVTTANLAYCNLHGVTDAPDWYGQRDSQESPAGPDYPVALSAQDLASAGQAPQVVFSEACYGAYIFNKKESESVALRFLGIGTQVFVGSTTVAYGSVDAPLIGADLIGSYFWKNLKAGCTAGEAYMRAKIELAREMNNRQGFLDGEDQKTLLSFVLYGDPLASISSDNRKSRKSYRPLRQFNVKTVCDCKSDGMKAGPLSEKVMKEVKDMVTPYLPGLEEAQVLVNPQYDPLVNVIAGGEVNKTIKTHDGHVVITFSKSVRTMSRVHRHYARATVNPEGKMVKLVVSR